MPLTYAQSSQMHVLQNEKVILESSLGFHKNNTANNLALVPCVFQRSYDGKWSLVTVD